MANGGQFYHIVGTFKGNCKVITDFQLFFTQKQHWAVTDLHNARWSDVGCDGFKNLAITGKRLGSPCRLFFTRQK